MKKAALIAIMIFLVFLPNCLKSEKQDSSDELSAETDSFQIKKSETKPILEVTQDARGMWSIVGETLFFRLSDGGVVEFEYPDDGKQPQSGIRNAAEVNRLVRVKVSDADFQNLLDEINAENFQKISGKYQRKCCCTDATLSYKINLRNADRPKLVNLIGYCGLNELKNPPVNQVPEIPATLSALMISIDSYRNKYIISAKSSNQPR